MGLLADVFDKVVEGARDIRDGVSELWEPASDDLDYIWGELAAMWHGDDDDDE